MWVIFALLDPDPHPDSEPGSGYGSTYLIESGSNPDPDTDPKHWEQDIRDIFTSYNPTLSLPLLPGEADHDEHPHAADQEDLQLEQGQRGAQPLSGRVGIKKPRKTHPKIPPKKAKKNQKNPPKKTTKMFFFWVFFKFLIFYENNTNFSLSNRFFMNK